MTEVAMTLQAFGADLALDGADLRAEDGLQTAVFLSLFSDARAPDGWVGGSDVRGWWPDGPQDRFGSHLWLLARESLTGDVLARAEGYAEAALLWLVEDGIAERVSVQAARLGTYGVSLEVGIVRGKAKLHQALWGGSRDTRLDGKNGLTVVLQFQDEV